MNTTLRIAVADDEPVMIEFYRKILHHMGHEVISESNSGADLIKACLDERPDLVITDIQMPVDGLEATREIHAVSTVPVILVTAYSSRKLIEQAKRVNVLAYLIKPITRGHLEAAIEVAMSWYETAEQYRRALEDRKYIDRAKGILMHRYQWPEAQAFQQLRKRSQDLGIPMVELAQSIIRADDLFSEIATTGATG